MKRQRGLGLGGFFEVLGVLILALGHLAGGTALGAPPAVVDPSSIRDKVICGYQGWYNCEGDASPIDLYAPGAGWRHWSQGEPPAPDRQTFELYPDVAEYAAETLFPTGYGELGDGAAASLFSSFTEASVDRHFAWMEAYGIDGVALQRFGVELRDPLKPDAFTAENRDAVTLKVKASAERHGRIFYILYDVSGMSTRATAAATEFTRLIMQDWEERIADPQALDILSSPSYAHQDGKPVVGIWGIGFVGRPGTPRQYLGLINWFKSQGCYVVGGVPMKWRKVAGGEAKPFFRWVYLSLDMLSPWTVGGYATDQEVDEWVAQTVLPDLQLLGRYSIAYQPVLYPGFAWSNWSDGPPNQIPRRAGALFWRQAYRLRLAGLGGGYIAMFDEYDEGTAIAKAAEDSAMIPVDQYFLTLSADGTYLSSDFYLRLAGRAAEMLKGQSPPVPEVPIPYSLGPVFFRTDLEAGLDAQPSWESSVDAGGGGIAGVTGFGGDGNPQCAMVMTPAAAAGEYALRYAGRDTSETLSHIYFEVFNVNIPVSAKTQLRFRFRPEQDLGRFACVDLVMTDGTTLRDSGAVDQDGVPMHPAAGRGNVGAWSEVRCAVGQWLSGKVIDRITIGYDHDAAAGDFRGLIDGIIIYNAQ